MIKNVSLFIALPSMLSASFDKPYQCIKSDFCFQAEIYLFKFNNKNTRKSCEMCSKLIIKAPERRHWHRSSVFIVNFWTYFMPFSSVSIVWRRRTGKILFDLSFLALMMRSRIILKKLQIFVTQLLEKKIPKYSGLFKYVHEQQQQQQKRPNVHWQSCAVKTPRCLKCVWPFFSIVHERIKTRIVSLYSKIFYYWNDLWKVVR